MDDLFHKYKDLLQKNEELTIENQKLTTQNTILAEEIKILKSQTGNSTELQERIEAQEKNFKHYLVQNKKFTMGLLGYEMEISDNTVELLSLYAFDRSDKIVFQIVGKDLQLLSNEFVDDYKELVDMYLVRGNSIPAFISSITIDLVNKKTFQ